MNKPRTIKDDFHALRADYDMSRESHFVRRRTGLAPQGGSADYHYRSEQLYYRDIEKARDMDRNDAVVGQTVDRAVANIVQEGFALDTKTGDAAIDQELKARWTEWATSPDACDIAGEFAWNDIERHVMRSTLLDGDIVALALESGQLQLAEAHTIQTSTKQPNTVLGVEINKQRKRLAYWFMPDGTTPFENIEIAQKVPVRDDNGNRVLFHVYNPKRTTQTRGVTAFAPIFSLAGMFEDINFAKVVQQQTVSCFAIFRKRAMLPSGDGLPSVGAQGYGDTRYETLAEGGVRRIEGIAPGMEFIGDPGEELQGFSPNVPNAEFFDHVKLMLQLIGVNLGLPLCLVLMDGSETNFSGWRGAVDEARKGFKANQTNLMQRLHSPVYKWKVQQWLDEDPALRAVNELSGINVFGHKWNAPTWQYIDPIKDAQGDALRLQNALTSPRRLHSEGGRDWEEISSETVQDNGLAIRKAKAEAASINEEYADGQPVHWRELISLPMPSGLQMQMSDPNQAAAQGSQEAKKLSIMEALQKIYLSVGKVITAEEARQLIEMEFGVQLPENFDPTSEAE